PTFDPYAEIAEFYDLEHDSFQDDVLSLMNFIESTGDPVLELGCGTGRFLVPIAETGFRVTGLDISAPMLDRAKSRITGVEGSELITLIQADLTEADSVAGGPFGVVLISLNGLLHATSSQDQRRVLTSAKRALDPRGQLLIDVLNPTPHTLAQFDQSIVLEGTWTRLTGGTVQKFSSRRLSTATQTIHTDLWYDIADDKGATRRIITQFDMRYLHPSELELMLELAGFPSWEIYGSYDLDPFDDHSERILVAAEAS
ncbi:MAG: class I SAM-dependent methyltransferase, partial [Thermomicrobiales bacterium]